MSVFVPVPVPVCLQLAPLSTVCVQMEMEIVTKKKKKGVKEKGNVKDASIKCIVLYQILLTSRCKGGMVLLGESRYKSFTKECILLTHLTTS